jgi:hypothetical protein
MPNLPTFSAGCAIRMLEAQPPAQPHSGVVVERPVPVTLIRVQNEAAGDFQTWIRDRKNRRQIPYRFEQCGYVPVRNDAAVSGLWVINRVRQVVYAKAGLSIRDRMAAARKLTEAPYA